MTAVRVADDDRLEDAFNVRRRVFVEEQGVDEELEYDEHEDEAVHFVAYEDDDEQPIGAARLREPEDSVGKVERVAVLESHRGTGVGRALMDALEAAAASNDLETLKLHAQTRAAGFYDELGYERYGEEFEEAGIPHVAMEKSLE
ncbi:GNAT family N-acetyltransferase [Halostagnicola kamekurae]|uniref:Predicted N-acyltransferase, GNAT family n=1 Tax=Halostagnicola kamekurae TaxID=619731 RepID=A0A1I6RRM3_9EURY|nr:GNAT family N-acetyltransferase [Halostagnicola kamekurae]SFS67334.1 Predicted N-acyltransferase, GNAT family [Halostagnicola kamekurae]